MLKAGRCSLCVCDDYAYVSVECDVANVTDLTLDRYRPMSHRYLGETVGDKFAELSASADDIEVSLVPTAWSSQDFRPAQTSLGW